VAAGVLTIFAVAASGRQWTRGRALGVVVGAEAGLHAWFCLTQPSMGMGDSAVGSPLMLGAHAAAAAAVAMLLAGGDAALWQVLTLLGRVVAAARHLVGARVQPAAAQGAGSVAARRVEVFVATGWLRSGWVRRRGPPAQSCP
jgi:hypothetical protein